jgi:hypothetical protein
MLNNIDWLNSLSEFEQKAFISWFKLNGVESPDKLPAFLDEIYENVKFTTLSSEAIISYLNYFHKRGFKRLPDELQYGITSAFGKMIKRSLEDDIHTQTIDLEKWRKDFTEACIPLGIDFNYLFSFVINIKSDTDVEILRFHQHFWPFPPHKLDMFYSQLLAFHFIEPSGHFKSMFLMPDPPLEDRILWKKNRTDLIYLSHRLYWKVYKDEFIHTINKLFYLRDKNGKVVTLQNLKKTNRNISGQIRENVLQGNWTTIDLIFKNIPLP